MVVGNNAEVDGIQTDDGPVDAQIGSWVLDNCHRRHGNYRDLEVVDGNGRYPSTAHVHTCPRNVKS